MASLTSDLAELSKRLSEKSSAPQIIVRMLREAIIAGRLKPGERLVETRVAQELGVGQPTVREALVALEHEGLIVRRPNRGCTVIELSRQEMDQIFRVRIEFEPFAVQLAKETWNKRKNAILAESLAHLKSAADQPDAEKFYRQDLEFHQTLWGLADNPFLQRALSQITIPLFSFVMLKVAKNPAFDLRANAAGHAKIAHAVMSRNVSPEDARQLTRDALRDFWNLADQL
jgi:DNA-binding GntR family transcriptional regulator